MAVPCGLATLTKIFLNYRRADNSPAVSLLRKNLEDYYEPEDIFQDLESIPKGAFFWKTIEQGIRDCDIQLVVIGPRWLAKNEQGQRRIDNPNDYVRREIELGMSLPTVRVVPVFIDGASPDTVIKADPLADSLRGLADGDDDTHDGLMDLNGATLSNDRIADDVRALIKDIDPTMVRNADGDPIRRDRRQRPDQETRPVGVHRYAQNPRMRAGVAVIGLALALVIGVGVAVTRPGSDRTPSSGAVSESEPLPPAPTIVAALDQLEEELAPISAVAGAAPVDLQGPTGLFERDGALYIADAFGNTVYRRSEDGTMTAVAGNGRTDVFTKSGRATEVSLNSPTAIAVGSDGTLWIADNGNDLVRRVDPKGSITSVVGIRGQQVFNGDGEAVARAVNPFALALGPDDKLYIADTQNHLVRALFDGVVDIAAGAIVDGKPEAGSSEGRISLPMGIAVDADNNLYVAERGNNRVVRVTAGRVTVIAGGGSSPGDGPALQAALSDPVAVTVAPDGAIYIAEYDGGRSSNARVRKLENGNLTTVAGVGSPGCSAASTASAPCRLKGPNGLLAAADGSGVYIAEFGSGGSGRVRKWISPGKLVTIQE